MELFVNTDTRSKLPVTSFDQENSFEKNNTITADIPITSHAMIVGINISKENVSFGTCSNIIAGRGIYIIYLFKIFEVSSGKILNFCRIYPANIATAISIKFSITCMIPICLKLSYSI